MESIKNSGDSNRITRDYFDSLQIELRHIDAEIPDTSLELYGEVFSTPIMTAALSHLNNLHPDGLVELARAAAAAKAVMWAGMGDESELEAIVATGARTIKIIKPYLDNDLILKKIAHAESSGAMAVGMDIDHAFNKHGEYDTVLGYPMKPKSLGEIKGFVKSTKLPFIIKGVLSETDAAKCAEAGVNGIVVSHHHGIINYALPPLKILPRIVKAVGHLMPVFVDCGISTGMDAFKALALGATAVSVGRALMQPLGKDGASGAQKTIEIMTNELANAMARTCSLSIKRIDSTVIWNT